MSGLLVGGLGSGLQGFVWVARGIGSHLAVYVVPRLLSRRAHPSTAAQRFGAMEAIKDPGATTKYDGRVAAEWP
jgi:hypothetical protein